MKFGVCAHTKHRHAHAHALTHTHMHMFTQVRSLEPLASLPASVPLRELYVASNKVPAITAISHLTHLTTLELGSNRIRQVCDMCCVCIGVCVRACVCV